MSGKVYSIIVFLSLFWIMCLYIGFKNQKKINSPVDFFIFGRELPGWSYITIITSTIFSGWIFFVQPALIFSSGFPYALTSLCVIGIPLIGILFSKKQWMLSKKFGFVTPGEMISGYFKSDILRVLIVIIALGFSIPFISMQLSLGGLLISKLSDNIIGSGSASILIGAVITIYLATSGMKSIVFIDSIQFLLIIFGVICLGFVTYDLVGGWNLLNESFSRIANLKGNLFNIAESYSSYVSVPGTIKSISLTNTDLPYNGIWTSSMILTFVLALAGLQISPNLSMLTYASKEIKYFGTQQIWFSGFLIGFVLLFFSTAIGVGSILLGGNSIINESGNNISNVLPANIYPENVESLIPSLINLIGEYSFVFFGILTICGVAAVQSTASLYLTSSAMITRDILKRFFVKNMTNNEQIFTSRIVLLFIFILSLILSIIFKKSIFDLGSFSLAMSCQMLVPLIAVCYLPWFTKQGVAFGIVVGIIAVIFTESAGQNLFSELIIWNKWPLSIHSSFWGIFFNLISASIISYITQDTKETNNKNKFHEFINEHKSYSITRRSLKPSAWIVTISWLFFALGPGLILGNELFGKPSNVESWSFGMPSIWVWNIIFWVLGLILVWFLAIKMEMSTPSDKNIVSQSEDISSSFR